ncbi:MAG: polysaccharide biosynthesis/export family protein [Chthoniobacterales bacterium]|jgi:protein involved in polysaccharide export with SLBB domain
MITRKLTCAVLAGVLLLPAVRVAAADVAFRVGDTMELRLGGVPSEETALITGSYTVDGEGCINLPHIGKVRAAGLSQSELQRAVEGSYRSGEIYTNPTVTITVPTVARFVNVSGDVRAPRRVEYTTDLTVLGAISAAGGFTDYADQRKVRLLRGKEVRMIDVKAVRANPALDLELLPGDRIEVPQSFW